MCTLLVILKSWVFYEKGIWIISYLFGTWLRAIICAEVFLVALKRGNAAGCSPWHSALCLPWADCCLAQFYGCSATCCHLCAFLLPSVPITTAAAVHCLFSQMFVIFRIAIWLRKICGFRGLMNEQWKTRLGVFR